MPQIWHFWHFWHFWHNWHIRHTTFVMPKYCNKGFKICVRTSGMQTMGHTQIFNRFNDLGLHSLNYYASFDTHIAISNIDKCPMPYTSIMSKMPKMPYWTPMPSDMCRIIYGNIGVKRCIRTSGIHTNNVKQLFNKFNCSKFQNTDFLNFPLYFFKISFV